MAITSWILMILTCLLAVVPVIGFASWVIAFVVIPLVIIFAIVILTRGGTGQGIFLLICSVILMPAFLFLAPVVSTLVLGASISAQETAQENQIVANLNKIDSAKSKWASETGAAAGATVNMSDLTKYLGGEEIKIVVGETYDPRPVGQEPAAKLPAQKSLSSHKAGEEITASSAKPAPSTQESTSASPSPSASAEEE
jgi:hypothetical protein